MNVYDVFLKCRVDLPAVTRWRTWRQVLCMLARCCPKQEYQNLVRGKRFNFLSLF